MIHLPIYQRRFTYSNDSKKVFTLLCFDRKWLELVNSVVQCPQTEQAPNDIFSHCEPFGKSGWECITFFLHSMSGQWIKFWDVMLRCKNANKCFVRYITHSSERMRERECDGIAKSESEGVHQLDRPWKINAIFINTPS